MAEFFRPLCLLLSVWIGSLANAKCANRQRIGLDACISNLVSELQSRQLVSHCFAKIEPTLNAPFDSSWLAETTKFCRLASQFVEKTDWNHKWNRSWLGSSLVQPQKSEMAQSPSGFITDLTSTRKNNDDSRPNTPKLRTNQGSAAIQNRTGEIGNMADAYWDYYESCDRWGAVFQKASWKRPALSRGSCEPNPTGHLKRLAARLIAVGACKIESQFKSASAWTTAWNRKLANSMDFVSTSLEQFYFLKLETGCFVSATEFEMISACEAYQDFHNCLPVFEKLAGENWASQFARGQNTLFFAAKSHLVQFFVRSAPIRNSTVEFCYLPGHEWSWTWFTFENSLSNGIRMCRAIDKMLNQLTKSLKSAASAFREEVQL